MKEILKKYRIVLVIVISLISFVLLYLIIRTISDYTNEYFRPEIISAIAAISYSILTMWFIFEIREDRRLGYKPVIKIIITGAKFPREMKYNIKNVGKGPALDVHLRCLCKSDKIEVEYKTDKKQINLGQNEKEDVMFFVDEQDKYPVNNIEIFVEYKDIFNNVFNDKIVFDIHEIINDY